MFAVTMYLDYVNNFLTVAAFADHYAISDELALMIIKEGRDIHELKVMYSKKG